MTSFHPVPGVPPWQPRAVCPDCRRPQSVCYCRHISPLQTRAKVVLLQHPREARMPVGTLRMAKLALPQAQVRVGIDFSDDPVLRALLAQAHPPHLLFPSPNARDVATIPRDEPITLLVVDGTWAQARKLLKCNPQLRQLPHVTFVPREPSGYQIRTQPAAECVSTIEALAHVLGELEGDRTRFASLLNPFRAMVQTQLHYVEHVRTKRYRRPRQRASRPPPADSAAVLLQHADNLVCVQGEANAWAKDHPDFHPPELMQWSAVRPATGETFRAIVRPRKAVAPGSPAHAELSLDELAQGLAWDDFIDRWRAFLRPTDHLAMWGRYFMTLARDGGVPLPEGHSDARIAASRILRRRPGTIERCAEALDLNVAPAQQGGRCDRRLHHLCAVVQDLMARESPQALSRAGISPARDVTSGEILDAHAPTE